MPRLHVLFWCSSGPLRQPLLSRIGTGSFSKTWNMRSGILCSASACSWYGAPSEGSEPDRVSPFGSQDSPCLVW